MGKHTVRPKSTREELKSARDEHARHDRIVGRREKSLLCDPPGSELRLLIGGREKKERAKIFVNRMKKRKKGKKWIRIGVSRARYQVPRYPAVYTYILVKETNSTSTILIVRRPRG